ncbi:ArsR/SmtB family transcription factor [Streptococcus ictaluri]|uniref:Transcriptional regulator, ArsR family n=1 Tax=Streptococcus ictaluri 707-05 TaxID=764299 RepID=G5K4V4_9STRE|nr:metalloregulator ArsR/SmtB family transcription factor [Streptococcus ictaluri]EHI68872.1 transcriptional regulator, ArsR family [Streptococcus ictaluri 707-05]
MSDFTRDAQLFKALADEKRLLILDYLKNGETCACVLIDVLGIAQSALSYHMKILCQSGIVSSRQDGKWKHYRLSESGADELLERLKVITDSKGEPANACPCLQKSS